MYSGDCSGVILDFLFKTVLESIERKEAEESDKRKMFNFPLGVHNRILLAFQV